MMWPIYVLRNVLSSLLIALVGKSQLNHYLWEPTIIIAEESNHHQSPHNNRQNGLCTHQQEKLQYEGLKKLHIFCRIIIGWHGDYCSTTSLYQLPSQWVGTKAQQLGQGFLQLPHTNTQIRTHTQCQACKHRTWLKCSYKSLVRTNNMENTFKHPPNLNNRVRNSAQIRPIRVCLVNAAFNDSRFGFRNPSLWLLLGNLFFPITWFMECLAHQW